MLSSAVSRWGRRSCVLMYLYGLRNVHLVDFNMRKAPAWHLFKILIVAVKQICGIDANTDGALREEEVTSRDKQR